MPDKKGKGNQVVANLGCLLFLAVIGGMGFMVWATNSHFFPPDRMIRGNDLNKRAMQQIGEVVPLEAGESILYYVSGASFSYGKDGQLLTDRRVVAFYPVDGQTQVVSIPYPDIVKLDMDRDTRSDNVQIAVFQKDTPEPLVLWAYDAGAMASTFYNTLLEKTDLPDSRNPFQ